MATLQARLEKLEAKMTGAKAPRRFIVVQGGAGFSDGAIEAFLATKGIKLTPSDQIAYIRLQLGEPDGSAAPIEPLQLLNITPCRGRT
ncbi:hypothetical protein [Aureimonas psammosilenae]|uniref:hypothetical protein n=1 Tax=Aureimonas psammosilenae TaxID=2495496 RepID=UPI0012610208|nr:hypothetical protein [Aureimonas psammosilenae]